MAALARGGAPASPAAEAAPALAARRSGGSGLAAD